MTNGRFSWIIGVFIVLYSVPLKAQTKAITERGDSVVLLEGGTWYTAEEYRQLLRAEYTSLDTSAIAYQKPEVATKQEVGEGGSYRAWYDGEQWESIDANLLNPQAELAFQYKGSSEEAYGMTVYEAWEIPTAQLQKIAVQQANKMGSNLKVLEEEYRVVNGVTVLYTQLEATVSGLDLVYHYYFASQEGLSLQYIVFTGKSYAEKVESRIMDLLNGLVVGSKK
ncbi:MAG: hypothetical protein AAFW73_18565 [Bacteroidota bacterium]